MTEVKWAVSAVYPRQVIVDSDDRFFFEEPVATAATEGYAKRIARTPAMEAEVVRLEEKADALLGHIEAAIEWLSIDDEGDPRSLADMLSKVVEEAS